MAECSGHITSDIITWQMKWREIQPLTPSPVITLLKQSIMTRPHTNNRFEKLLTPVKSSRIFHPSSFKLQVLCCLLKTNGMVWQQKVKDSLGIQHKCHVEEIAAMRDSKAVTIHAQFGKFLAFCVISLGFSLSEMIQSQKSRSSLRGTCKAWTN